MMLSELLAEYHPYDCMQAFHDGFTHYQQGNLTAHPFKDDSVEGQAYDRGAEAAMRWQRRKV